MKKLYYILIFIISFSFISCAKNTQYINFKSKPSKYYYTNELINNLKKDTNYKVSLFDNNLYKELKVPDDEKSVLYDFLVNLDKENFPDEAVTQTAPKYKLIVEANNTKYIINVINENEIVLNPWDGVYTEDYITMDNTPVRYNVYNFCKYIMSKYESGEFTIEK